ncbi:MAG TPA: hypothetical protein VGQ83_10980 [Polyangia bacterium]|jgi:hypothetical protein
MDTVITESGGIYAQPLSGLRVSFGAVVSGALATIASGLIIWALALAIILTVTRAHVGAFGGSMLAMLICGIITTWIGAFVGGALAGYLPGNARRTVSFTHAGLSWALAFIVVSLFQFGVLSGIARTATATAVSTAGAAAQTAGSAVSGPVRLDQRAMAILESLGYSPQQAQQMVTGAQQGVQQRLRGGAGPTGPRVRGAFGTLATYLAGLSWAWFGTWFVGLGLALAGALLATRRLEHGLYVERRERIPREPYGTEPYPTPA